MFLKKNLELCPKGRFPMMVSLVLNVFRRLFYPRNPNAKRAVTFLPLESPMLLECVMNPFR